jgi:hypothetical protein
VGGRDRRLQLVGADGARRDRLVQHPEARRDRRRVPARAVLLVQRHQFAALVGAGRAARVGEEHQRQEAADLGLLGQRQPRDPGQPDRLGGQLGPGQVGARARRVALVEDQVEDRERGPQPLLAFRGGGEAERLRGRGDRLPGAGDPPSHRLFGDEEGGGDLRGREAADGAQGEGDRRGRGQLRPAAHEDQRQGVVCRGRGTGLRFDREPLLPRPPCGIGADPVGHPS